LVTSGQGRILGFALYPKVKRVLCEDDGSSVYPLTETARWTIAVIFLAVAVLATPMPTALSIAVAIISWVLLVVGSPSAYGGTFFAGTGLLCLSKLRSRCTVESFYKRSLARRARRRVGNGGTKPGRELRLVGASILLN
jgi:hypothetical protein